jgi:putative Mn2+ efflux pump MntP
MPAANGVPGIQLTVWAAIAIALLVCVLGAWMYYSPIPEQEKRIEADSEALNNVLEMARELERFTIYDPSWTTLDKLTVRLRLSRLGIAYSSKKRKVDSSKV